MTRTDIEILVPEQVRTAAFSSARFGRRGLDENEVNSFCEWVADGVTRLRNDNNLLQAEISRLRQRLLDTSGTPGALPEDGHVQAVAILSKAQQTADRYVADAQEYSRELAEDARMRRDEILREAKMRASMIIEEARGSAAAASADASVVARERSRAPLPEQEARELQSEIAYLRTFSSVARTNLRAYLESLGRSLEEWERAEHKAATAARDAITGSVTESVLHATS
jgi:cell division septum initiation protein DivIVA